MAKEDLLRLFVSNAVLAIVCGLSLPPTTVVTEPPPVSEPRHCVVDGAVYKPGERWYPDPCTSCYCEDYGEHSCSIGECYPPQCHDYVYKEGECCAICPNGENCVSGNTVIPKGKTITTEYGEECWCEQEDDYYLGALKGVCNPPPAEIYPPPAYAYPLSTPSQDCDYNGKTYKSGESFEPDPCTWCRCDAGQVECDMAGCPAPPCVDEAYDPTECCPYCPNGPNCFVRNRVISLGETVTLDSGETCTCQPTEWDYPDPVCTFPAPATTPEPTTRPPTSTSTSTTTLSSKEANRQARQEERQAKQEARQAKREARQAKKAERQAKKAERQARKAERQANRAARQAEKSN